MMDPNDDDSVPIIADIDRPRTFHEMANTWRQIHAINNQLLANPDLLFVGLTSDEWDAVSEMFQPDGCECHSCVAWRKIQAQFAALTEAENGEER
jgi:hypothetical protein